MSNLSERLGQLSAEQKRALLADLLQKKTARHPLSHAQKSLWFLHQLAPESAVYNVMFAWRLRAGDSRLLHAAFQALVDRHPVLRTTFSAAAGEPYQCVHADREVPFLAIDARAWSAEHLHAELGASARRPFDLEAGPLLRVELYERGAGEDVLLLCVHHIAIDLWSLSIVLDELGEIYTALKNGRTVRLDAPSVQYTDYVRWQQTMLTGPRGEALHRYWQAELADPPVLNLPTDRPRPALQTFAGASVAFELDAALSGRLKELAAREKTTLYAVMLAALQVLLFRYTGQTDLLIATPSVGRPRAELAGLVGYFANPVALRGDLTGDPNFRTFLARVRSKVLAALDHEDYPFDLLVEQLLPGRDPSRSPLTDVLFALEKPQHLVLQRTEAGPGSASPFGLAAAGMRGIQVTLGELVIESYPLDWSTARCDLDLLAIEAGETIACSFQYNTALFDAATIRRLARHFENLLADIVKAPHRQLSELEILDGDEHRQLLGPESQDTDYASAGRFRDRFEARVVENPGAIVATCLDEHWSYDELNRRANRLAHHLLALGVGPEARVAICVERNLDILVGLLATLKAGGACVPLDPAYPAERLALMIQDADAAVVITRRALLERLPINTTRVCLDEDGVAGYSDENPTTVIRPEQLAYVVYTSGTTGRPKPVLAEQRNLDNYLLSTRDRFGLDRSTVIPCLASFAFSISLFELLAPLQTGGQVVVVPHDRLLDLAAFVGDLDRFSSVHFTPGLLRQVIARVEAEGRTYPKLRQIFTGGDGVAPELLSDVRRVLPGVELFVLYGCSEGSTLCTVHPVPPLPSPRRLIGAPFANVHIRLYDEHGGLVPVGVPGEIYVGGAGVTRGYAHRPELTETRYRLIDGERFYRTGDLARRRSDGSLEFLGRGDHQVKIRGFRIELGEIEATLDRHPEVRQAVVTVRADGLDDGDECRQLVAYLVPQEGCTPVGAQVRRFLQEQLPDYMVPTAFVVLERLPLTPNQKVDRRALPAPEQKREVETAFLVPRTELESRLAAIWAALLGLTAVGIEDNFFELGGHSLLATRLIARIREDLQVDLPLPALFAAPTVAGLARSIEATRQAGCTAPAIRAVSRERDLPLSFAQQRLWFLDQLDPGTSEYNLPAAIRLEGTLDAEALHCSLNSIVARHEALRTRFLQRDDRPVQVIDPVLELELPIADLSGLAESERQAELARRIAVEENRRFDLAGGPLLCASLLRLAAEEHILLLNLHHIVFDGWSIGVLTQELSALYGGFRQGGVELPPLLLQYADFACWQQDWMRGEVFERELEHWKGVLAGELPVLNLPTDRPRPPVQSFRGDKCDFALDVELSVAIRDLAQRESLTVFMVLFAALQTLFYRYTAQEDILTGVAIANRSRAELEHLVGYFVNNVVLRTRPTGRLSFRELLAQVGAVAQSAYAHQDLPFVRLVEAVQPQRSLSQVPLFQVIFICNPPLPALEMPGLQTSYLDSDVRLVTFDLEIHINEGPGTIHGHWRFNSDLFDAPTVERMLGHYQSLLAAALANPDCPLVALQMLSEAEVGQLAAYAGEPIGQAAAPVHRRFEAQAQRTPEATAVQFGETRLTYSELDQQANRLAHHLQSLGVGPGTLVGLCLDRSLDPLVGLLAIWKAGGVYVPLDPTYPAERLAYITSDARLAIVVTEQSLVGRFAAPAARFVLLDTGAEAFAAWPATPPAVAVGSDALAYAIYTSGTTGRPKAVLVEHGNLSAVLDSSQTRFAFCAEDVVPAIAPFAFDISLFELLNPLLVGGTVLVLDREEVLELEHLEDWLGRVSVVHAVPSLLKQMLAQIDRCGSRYPNLRLVLTGGDSVPPALLATARRLLPAAQLHVLYGPTEATIICTSHAVEEAGERTLIGRPLPHARIRLFDRDRTAVPVGVPGELYVGGAGVSRGYHDRPELSAERYVRIDGERFYRTGDLARWLPDGTLEFLGRLDDQVKIRGHRVEPAEIEAVLARHPGVATAAVVAWPDPAGEKRLVAYTVGKCGAPEADDLRHFALAQLPDYMVPAAFVELEKLPLGPTGKLDRKALPVPAFARLGNERTYVAPRTPEEETLAAILQEVLGVERVGVHDSFFELGGHSLLATQAISRIRTVFGIDLPLRRLFEQPTAARLAELIGPVRTALPVGSNLPLDPTQRRLLFLERLQPGNPFHAVLAVRLEGGLDRPALEDALAVLAGRHEALRAVFFQDGDSPAGIVRPRADLPLTWTDLGETPGELGDLAAQAAQRPFDLSRTAWRAELVRLGPTEHVLVLVCHRLVGDDAFVRLLYTELAACYTGEVAGDLRLPAPAQPAAIPEQALAFWRARLSGAPAVSTFTPDRPRPPVQSFRGAECSEYLDEALTGGLEQLAAQSGCDLATLLLSAFQALCRRYTGQADLVIGFTLPAGPCAHRTATLPVRTVVAGAQPFAEHLQYLAAELAEVRANAALSYEQLLDYLETERDLSHTPLYQVVFELVEALPRLRAAGLAFEPVDLGTGIALFDLTLSVRRRGRSLRAVFTYNRDLFAAETIAHLATHFRRLLQAVVAEPTRPIDRLPLLGADEQQRLLVEFNRTDAALPDDGPVHEQIARLAALEPDRPALVAGEQALSFAELDKQANRLAHHLQSLGVGPEVSVGVCLERSLELVVALLAVWKAGGAYVPIDPAYPAERLAFLVADSQAAVLLTRTQLHSSLPREPAALCLDALGAALLAYPDSAPPAVVGAATLAYIVYTSGSTGWPKGVQIEHGSLLNFVHWYRQVFSLSSADRTTQLSGMAFDASVLELWPALSAGACVFLADEETRLSPPALRDFLVERGVTVCFATTPLAEPLLSLDWPEDTALRVLCTGGDRLVRRPGAHLTFRLYNLYGPTENAVVTTAYAVPTADSEAGPPPIGRPIANHRVYVLDADRQPVPVGVGGELYVGGAGLARGYLGRPDLTAERFVVHRFVGADAPVRLYRTGDLVRWNLGGQLEYLGRIDDQVKISGFRIELGEVEAVLTRHPAVGAAAVIAREDIPGHKRLVAYLVLQPGSAEPDRGWRAHLQRTLPEYMVPAVFVVLAALPLTANGKLDRKALPAPADGGRRSGAAFVALSTPTEEVLAHMWSEILQVDPVGAEDNFFELGGHSLFATQVMTRVRSAFLVDLPLRCLFEQPTVAGLARRIRAARRDGMVLQLQPIPRVRRDGELPLSFSQQRLWFLDQLDPGSPIYNIPLPIHLKGPLDALALERSLDEVIRRHEALRTTFGVRVGQPFQVIAPALNVRLEQLDLSTLPAAEREAAARRHAWEDAHQGFDLAVGPLVRARLLHLGEAEHILLFNIHHIAADGWSMGVIVHELAALYTAFCASQPSPLPELSVQYADFACWQRNWLQGEVLAAQLAYWREKLDGAARVLPLPTDRPRPPVQSYRGGLIHFDIPVALAERLEDFSQKAGGTLFMTLLAVFNIVLSRYSDQLDILVGSPSANRSRAELEPMIGLFINTLVLRTDLSGDPSFRELFDRVWETTLQAYAYQDLPLEMQVEQLQIERDLSYNPLFQVMCIFQNAPMPALRLGDITFSLLESFDPSMAKLDLTLNAAYLDGRLQCMVDYNADLFETPTIERLIGHLLTLLEAAVADPGRRLSELNMLTAAEERSLHSLATGEQIDFGEDAPVHRLVEAQAARRPEAVAVRSAARTLTYAELDRQANRLAHHLGALGCLSGSFVGVCLERDVDAVVALLAVWKAGCVYVPLDPTHPSERLAAITADAGLVLILAGPSTAGSVGDRVPVVLLAEVSAGYPDAPPTVEVSLDRLAYVIYTSGTTGQPKGVLIEHGSLLNVLLASRHEFGFCEEDTLPALASFAFDISLFELLNPLIVGGTVLVLDREEILDLERLSCRLEEATAVHAVPGLLRQLLLHTEANGAERFARLRAVFTGGDAVPPDLLVATRRLFPTARTWVLYGPTEGTIICMAHASGDHEDRARIGVPLANAQIRLYDREGRLVPVGVPGELYVGGAGVSRGYHDRPELSAERYVRVGGERFYRTGDLARRLNDGTLEFLGRLDDQVKIRGFRIEPGEVEAVLTRHPDVGAAAVIAHEDNGEKSLVAYVVAQADIADLRRFVAARLPEYMVPAVFVVLAALPLTANGKLDRKALPTPQVARADSFVPPRDVLELQLVQIWEALFNRRPIGVTDNFFHDLGGHSLLAVRLAARIQEQFGRSLPLAALFQGATVAQLAALLREQIDISWSPLVAIQPLGTQPPFFCVHPVGGNVLCYFELAGALGPEQPFYGLQAPGQEPGQQPLDRIEAMAEYYIEAMRAVQPEGPYCLGGWSFGGLVALEMARRLEAGGERVGRLVLIDCAPPPPGGLPVTDEAEVLAYFAADLAARQGIDLPVSARALGELAPDERLGLLLEQARQANLLIEDIQVGQLERLLAVYRANLRASEHYRVCPYAGPVTLLAAAEVPPDVPTTPHDWKHWLGELRLEVLAGDHYSILQRPRVDQLAARLGEALKESP